MRVWIVGLVCALVGGGAFCVGAKQGAWLAACGGAALLIASIAYVVRPGRRSLGLVELCWGGFIIANAIQSGHGIDFATAYSSGQSVAVILGGILVIAGVINLIRSPRSPVVLAPEAHEGWRFADAPNTAVFSTKGVTQGREPILFVTHDAEDGEWQFLGARGAAEDEASLVALSTIVKLDRTVAELADLPLGFVARRDSASAPWRRSRNA